MSASFTYLLVNIGAIIIPFLFSFHSKLRFNKFWKPTFLSILIVGVVFIGWDMVYTELNVWGFNKKYLLGFYVMNLPIEEILFFVCIPYACIYTYHCLKKLISPFKWWETKWVSWLLSVLLQLNSIIYYDNKYTSVTFFLLSLLILFLQKYDHKNWLPRSYLSLLVLILPFFVVNGILTGMGLKEEVVWYNPNEMIGLRVGTIPIEDFFYGALLILSNVYLFETFSSKLHIEEGITS